MTARVATLALAVTCMLATGAAARTPRTRQRGAQPSSSPAAADLALAAEAAGSPYRIIAMSLYGADPDYTYGAIENAAIVKRDWATWRLRIYHDQYVPADVLKALRALDVELVARTFRPDSGHEAMFWRFDVIKDEAVTRFLIRDTDARLTHRDRSAVNEWVSSRRYAHTIRDHPQHYMPIMGGLWGAVGGFMAPIDADLTGSVKYNVDQRWLQRRVWPYFKKHALIHDAYFCYDELRKGADWRPFSVQRESSQDFVGNKYMADNHYVGMKLDTECPTLCRGNVSWAFC